MQLYNTISAKAVVGRVLRDFNASAFRTYDAMEWIGDGIARIGYHIGLVTKGEIIPVVNNTIDKPHDFFKLNYISHNGGIIPYGRKARSVQSNASIFDNDFDQLVQLIQSRNYSVSVSDGMIDIDGYVPCVAGQYKLLDANNIERVDNTINHLLEKIYSNAPSCKSEYLLSSEGNCFKTSIEKGFVIMSYDAYPVDSDGYPMVINEPKYLDALSWYVMYKLACGEYQHRNLPFEKIERNMELYIGRARNQHMKMTTAQYNTFVDNWTNMRFRIR